MFSIRPFARERKRRQTHRPILTALKDRSSEIFAVEYDNPKEGLFAQLNVCLMLADLADSEVKRLRVALISENYRDPGDDADWFSRYFTQSYSVGPPPNTMAGAVRITDKSAIPQRSYKALDIKTAHDLFHCHFGIRADIEAEVAAFASAHGVGQGTLAIHYRGTDKHAEAPQQAVNDVLDRVARYAETQDGVQSIFVASDDARFVDSAHAGVAGLPVTSLDDSIRSTGTKPVHINDLKSGNQAMARDAILNCLMLSRCAWLCRTSSFLSAWSVIFNPALRVAMLNQPFEGKLWFPEKRILPDAQFI